MSKPFVGFWALERTETQKKLDAGMIKEGKKPGTGFLAIADNGEFHLLLFSASSGVVLTGKYVIDGKNIFLHFETANASEKLSEGQRKPQKFSLNSTNDKLISEYVRSEDRNVFVKQTGTNSKLPPEFAGIWKPRLTEAQVKTINDLKAKGERFPMQALVITPDGLFEFLNLNESTPVAGHGVAEVTEGHLMLTPKMVNGRLDLLEDQKMPLQYEPSKDMKTLSQGSIVMEKQ